MAWSLVPTDKKPSNPVQAELEHVSSTAVAAPNDEAQTSRCKLPPENGGVDSSRGGTDFEDRTTTRSATPLDAPRRTAESLGSTKSQADRGSGPPKLIHSIQRLRHRFQIASARAARRGRPVYLIIYESELRVIAGHAAAWGEIEVPLSMFGTFDHYGRPVVSLVLGPGPKAICQRTYCEHDLDHYRACARFLGANYGLQPNGSAHSHHVLCLFHPSGGDEAQVRSITSRNDFRRWSDIIANVMPDNQLGDGEPRTERFSQGAATCRVRLDAFVYPDPSNAQWVRLPIRVLPGMSPTRLAMIASQRLDAKTLGLRFGDFSLDRIDYDAFCGATCEREESDLEALAAQLGRLPSDVQARLQLRRLEDSVVVRLPCGNDAQLEIDVAAEAPHLVLRVRLHPTAGATPVDLTGRLDAEGRRRSVDQVLAAVRTDLDRHVQAIASRADHERVDMAESTSVTPTDEGAAQDKPDTNCLTAAELAAGI